MKPARRRAFIALLLCPWLSGCLQHLPAALPPAELGYTDSVPVEPAAGSAHMIHFFGWRRFGDDTTEAAIRKAKKGRQDLDLINLLVNRRVLCFPACRAALITWSETAVTGTLVRYKRLPDWEKPSVSPLPKLRLGKAPPAEKLVERLMNVHRQDAKAAVEFYESIDNGTQREMVDFILANKGLISSHSWVFKIPRNANPDERRFLGWFVGTYTTYQARDE